LPMPLPSRQFKRIDKMNKDEIIEKAKSSLVIKTVSGKSIKITPSFIYKNSDTSVSGEQYEVNVDSSKLNPTKLDTTYNYSTEFTWENKYKSGEIFVYKDIFEPYCCECMGDATKYEIIEYSERQGNVGSKMAISSTEEEEDVLKEMLIALFQQRYWFIIPLCEKHKLRDNDYNSSIKIDGTVLTGFNISFENRDFAISFAKKYNSTVRYVSSTLKAFRIILGVVVAILGFFLFFKWVDFKDRHGLIILIPVLLICAIIWALVRFTILTGKKVDNS
jgi:hypothetical protein